MMLSSNTPSMMAEEAAAAMCLLSMKSALTSPETIPSPDNYNSNTNVHRPQNRTHLPMPLSTPNDAQFLSPLQCYIRQHCVEFFAVENGQDYVAKGRQTQITSGRVGIRCVFCKWETKRASQSTSFPAKIDKLYSAGSMIQCRHMNNCAHIPKHVKESIARLKKAGSGQGVDKEYWDDSARELGFIDTDDGMGIRFCPNTNTVVPTPMEITPTTDTSNEIKPSYGTTSQSLITITPARRPRMVTPVDFTSTNNSQIGTLVTDADKGLVQDHVFLAFAQMEPTVLTEEDKKGPWKDRKCGEIGLRCRHCTGQSTIFGKWFPSSRTNLGQTTTMNSIVNHARTCPSTPQFVKDNMTSLLHQASTKATEVKEKKKYGSRKEFCVRVFARMTGYDPRPSLQPPLSVFSPIVVETDDEDEGSYYADDVTAGSKRIRVPSADDFAGEKRMNV